MRSIFIAALGAACLAAGTAAAQQAGAPTQEVGLPLVEGMTFDDACGPRPEYQGKAKCVRGALAAIEPVAVTYINHFTSQGWEVVSGHANGVVFARRRPDGGCDGLEMAAFYDESRPVAPATQAWLAFAPLPGDLCAGAAAQ
jgi:hypothetical protein